MPLHRLYNLSTGTGNPSYLTGLQAGGAGSATAGVQTNPMISAPRLEESTIEVLDCTAPSTLSAVANVNTPGTPAPAGKVLVMDTGQGAFGSRWVQNKVKQQAVARGQYGIVVSPGQVAEVPASSSTSTGNQSPGTKAIVMYDGPVQAFVQTSVGGVAISVGMPLSSDGAGNLTAFSYNASTTPAAGTILATYADANMATSVSIPQLKNVYVGGY